jgi:hypothetical protein
MAGWRGVRLTGLAVAALLTMGADAQPGWLSVCGKCMSPSITSTSGLGTATAVAVARMGRNDAAEWCASWEPEDASCLRRQMADQDFGKTFRATADCTRGRITAIDGASYTHAGLWDDSDIGGGRSRWRDAQGQIVGRDNASNGLAIAQQWEVLCPKGLVRASAPAPGPSAAGSPAGAAFAVGQAVEAKFMSGWVRGRVTRLRPTAVGVDYEVVLVNGQRGIVPARMLRPAGP